MPYLSDYFLLIQYYNKRFLHILDFSTYYSSLKFSHVPDQSISNFSLVLRISFFCLLDVCKY